MTTNSTQAQREGGQRLGAVEFLVADQQRDDLHGDGGDGLKRVGGQVGGQAGGHDDDHGLADGARDRQQDAADDARQGGRQDHLADGLRLGRAEAVGAVAQAPGARR